MAPDAAYADPEAHGITRWLGEDAELLRPRLRPPNDPRTGASSSAPTVCGTTSNRPTTWLARAGRPTAPTERPLDLAATLGRGRARRRRAGQRHRRRDPSSSGAPPTPNRRSRSAMADLQPRVLPERVPRRRRDRGRCHRPDHRGGSRSRRPLVEAGRRARRPGRDHHDRRLGLDGRRPDRAKRAERRPRPSTASTTGCGSRSSPATTSPGASTRACRAWSSRSRRRRRGRRPGEPCPRPGRAAAPPSALDRAGHRALVREEGHQPRHPAHRRPERERGRPPSSSGRSTSAAGTFQCDCRGVGTDWEPWTSCGGSPPACSVRSTSSPIRRIWPTTSPR